MTETEDNKQPKLVKSIVALSVSRYFQFVARIFTNIISSRVLGPELKGLWGALSMVIAMSRYYDLGLMAAMRRELPLLYTQQKMDEAEALRDGVFSVSVVVSLVVAATLLCYVLALGEGLDQHLRLGLVAVSGILLFHRVALYSSDFFSANRRFVELSAIRMVEVAVASLFIVVLVYPLSIYGVFIAELISWGVFALYGLRKIAPRFSFRIGRARLFELIKVGLPLSLLALGYTAFTMVDRFVILGMLDLTSMGLYSIAMLALAVVQVVPDSVKGAIQPEILRSYARHDQRAELLRPFALLPVYLVAVLMAILVGCGYFVLPHFIHFVLPEFSAGVLPAQILLLGSAVRGLALVPQQVLVATKRFAPLMRVVVASIAINTALNIFSVQQGWGLVGIAISTSVTYFLYALAINKLVMIDIFHYRIGDFLRHVVKAMSPIFYVFLFLLAAELYNAQQSLAIDAVALLLLLVYMLPLYRYALNARTQLGALREAG